MFIITCNCVSLTLSLPPQLPSALGYLCMPSPLLRTCLTWLSPWLPPPFRPAVLRYHLCREISENHTWSSPGSLFLRCSLAAWPSFIFLHSVYHHTTYYTCIRLLIASSQHCQIYEGRSSVSFVVFYEQCLPGME